VRAYRDRRRPKVNLCGCGCGGLTGYTFVHGHHTRLFTSEEQARRGRQNDGSALRDTGVGKSYRKVGQRHEHRTVAEEKLGRPLRKGEIVHHEDDNKRNNDPDNLEVMTQAEHMRLHHPEMMAARKRKQGW
jgi:hypothetical protein